MATNREIIEEPAYLGMLEIMDRFSTDEKARKFLEAVRWPEGPVCPHCGNCDKERVYKIEPNPEKKVRPGLYKCAECRKQFTVTVGTIFEKSKVPLRKWMLAWYLVCSSKNGISALELQRHLKLGSYRTAWHMLHRIRYALKDPVFDDQLEGEIEADEVYLGGKPKSMKKFMSAAEKKARRIKANAKKMPVVSVLERGGRVRSFSVTKVNGESVREILLEHVAPTSTMNTDESQLYKFPKGVFAGHRVVRHSIDEYVRGPATTNAVEGYFGNLRRSLDGTYKAVSRKHLPNYLSEFDFRYNTRKMSDGERLVTGLPKAEGKKLPLKKLKG